MRKPPSPGPPPPRRLSLVAQTAASLRDGIVSGHWKGTLPGERQLCARLQVSRPTLRAALEELRRTGWIDVSARQRRHIRQRRTLRPPDRTPKVVAVLAPAPVHTLIPLALMSLDALRERLTHAGYSVQLHVNPASYALRPARALEKLVAANPSSAWLLMGTLEPLQRWFAKSELRCVVMGTPGEGISLPSIDSDHRAVCRHATQILLRKGHKSLAVILPQGIHGGDAESERGFHEAIANWRAPVLPRVLQQDGKVPSLCRLLDETLRLSNPPTAFVVARARATLTVVTHLLRRRIRLPQDVAVISRDDDAFLHFATPAITRYAVDPMQFAHRLAMAVRQLAEDGIRPAQPIRLMPKFLPGETV